jgi:hypothetical protein
MGACGRGHSAAIASVGGNAAGATTTTTISGDQAFLDYAKCMRDHGVSDFADPVQRPGHNGLSLFYSGDTGAPVFKTADTACRHLIQSVIDVKSRNAHDALTPERLQGLIAYARCMRDHQIPMLDPDPTDGHISLGTVLGVPDNGITRKDPVFAAADAACKSLLPAGVSDDGTGPP